MVSNVTVKPSITNEEKNNDGVLLDRRQNKISNCNTPFFANFVENKLTGGTPEGILNGIPEVTEGISKVTEGIPEVTEGIPEVTEGIPEVTEGIPKVTEGIPKVTEVIPEVTEVIPEVTEVIPEVTEGIPEKQNNDTDINLYDLSIYNNNVIMDDTESLSESISSVKSKNPFNKMMNKFKRKKNE